MHAVFGRQLRHRALAFHGFQRDRASVTVSGGAQPALGGNGLLSEDPGADGLSGTGSSHLA